jgi:hypothetical protein
VIGGNRHQRRTVGMATKKHDKAPPVPPLKIKIARIDPVAKKVTMETVSMTPEAMQTFMGKHRWHQAVIGHENGADVMVMGDNFPQVTLLRDPEPTWMLRGGNFGPGPVCHGIGAVIGLLHEAKKATSLPIDVEWVLKRIVWDATGEEE